MYVSIALAVGAFVLVIAALFYDAAEGRFRVSFWDSETFRFVDPGRTVIVLLAIAGIVLVVSVGKAVIDGWRLAAAEEEAIRQRLRVESKITKPEISILTELSGEDLRRRAPKNYDVSNRLQQLLALAKATPIPPDACAGIELARGKGAILIAGDLLADQGGLTPADFALTLGFYPTGKDVARFTKAGFDVFDMSLAIGLADPKVLLSYVRESDTFRLLITDDVKGLTTDPETIASIHDLPGSTAVLEAGSATSAFDRRLVKSLVIRDKVNGKVYGIDVGTMAPAAAADGWPPHSFAIPLGDSVAPCLTASPGDSRV
jgi:hypothetical protein